MTANHRTETFFTIDMPYLVIIASNVFYLINIVVNLFFHTDTLVLISIHKHYKNA